jgi:hypothetical protein
MVVMPVSPALHQAKTGGSQVQLLVNLKNSKSAWATPLDPEIPRQRDFQFNSRPWDELVTLLDHHPGGCDMHNYHHGHFILFYEWGWKSFQVIDDQFHDFLLTSTKFSSAFHSSLYINDIDFYLQYIFSFFIILLIIYLVIQRSFLYIPPPLLRSLLSPTFPVTPLF